MKLFKSISFLVLTILVCSAAYSSEESIAHIHKMSIWADAGKPFGEVGATLQTRGSQPNHRIKSIILTVNGKKLVVPQASFKDLQRPQIDTARFHTESGRSILRVKKDSGSPWLYLVFRLENPKAKSILDYPKVYIRFRDGKLQTTQVFQNNQIVGR